MAEEILLEGICGSLRRRYSMGFPVLVLGETGSGKTYSIKNFDVDEVGIFSVEKNRLPFK
jgi:type IV secretory pathway ATPase VirB11/archaellum biosynthesis ATPase